MWDSSRGVKARLPALALIATLTLPSAACVGAGFGKVSKTTSHGYIISDMAIEQIPVGSSKDQVLIALGSPSTTGNYGGEVFYYISQTRKQPVAFMNSRVVDQQVLAVYFDQKDQVERIANYGLKDGKVFDFISRTTPTGGKDAGFLQGVLGGLLKGGRG